MTQIEAYLTSEGKWLCIACGRCCKFAHLLTDMSALPQWVRDRVGDEPFPKEYLKGKSCIHLRENNLCAIYESRPKVCRIPKDAQTDFQLANACATLWSVEP
jgi:Fe-S-cluster containining protein